MQIRFAALVLTCLFAGLFALTIDTPTEAATTLPTKMNFQGRITNNAGATLANGTYNMRFRIWTAASGGTQQWSESRLVSASQGVIVTNGQFSVQLGSITSLPASVFTSNSLYFEIELPTPASATTSSPVWTEGAMTPRNQLATTAYAYNAETLDGIDSDSFAQLGVANTFTSGQSVNVSNANALQVRNGSTNLFNVDSVNSVVAIGASDTTGAVLVLDTKTNSGDPAGGAATNGAMYYNSNTNKFRCYQNGAWTDCIGAGGTTTLQNAYDNSGSPALITTTAAKGVQISAGAAPTGNMLMVSNAGFATATNDANAIEVNYFGGATGSIEGSGVRVDYSPGSGTSSTWNGMRIISNSSTTGTTNNGIKLEGPATGNGTDTAVNIGTGWDIGVDINSGGLQMASMSSDPSTPAAGELKVYSRLVAGRSLLSSRGPSGVSFAYQPSLFQQSVSMVTIALGGAAYTSIGSAFASVGTFGTAGVSQATGYYGTIAGSTTANSGNGIHSTTAQYYRGSGGTNADGYFYFARFGFSNTVAQMSNATTGMRFYAGLGSNSFTGGTPSYVSSDNAANSGSNFGLIYSPTIDATNFRIATADGTTRTNTTTTGVALNAGKTYDFYAYSAPGGTTNYWRLDNMTDGTSAEGSVTANLPSPTTPMRAGISAAPLSTTAHPVRFQRMYVETDR